MGDSNIEEDSTFDRYNVAEKYVATKDMVPECPSPKGSDMKSCDEYQVHARRSPLVSLESKFCVLRSRSLANHQVSVDSRH